MRPFLPVVLSIVVSAGFATTATAGINYHEQLTTTSPWRQAIPANPVLDGNSAQYAQALTGGSHGVGLHDYAIPVYTATAGSPRYPVDVTQDWGPNPFGQYNPIPIPDNAVPAPGSDGWLTVVDPVNNRVYQMWQARKSGGTWTASFGDVWPYRTTGTASNRLSGVGNGAGVDVSAGLIRAGEARRIAAASPQQIATGNFIGHALSFSSWQDSTAFRYPASKSDGCIYHGCGPVPMGARVQLDPQYDLQRMINAGAPKGDLAVARALQVYGAFLYDSGGATMAFIAEGQTGSMDAYVSAGWKWDYWDMASIPWSQLRVLRQSDGR